MEKRDLLITADEDDEPMTSLLEDPGLSDKIALYQQANVGNVNPLGQSGVFSIPAEDKPSCCRRKYYLRGHKWILRMLLVPMLCAILPVLLLFLLRQEEFQGELARLCPQLHQMAAQHRWKRG